MTHAYLTGMPRPRVIAHRGLVTPEAAERGVAENSFAALRAAAMLGDAYLESDCHLTRDGEVVLFHDADLTRVTGDPRRISEVSAEELAALMAGLGGLATLREALAAFPGARWNLDVKAAAAAAPVGRLVAPHADHVLVTSFSDARRLEAMRAAEISRRSAGAEATIARPATSAGRGVILRLLLATLLRSPGLARRALSGIDAVQIPERQGRLRVLRPRLIAYAHAAGVEVHVWTVNDPDDMRRLAALGVDGIVTDRADVAREVLHGSGRAG